MENLVTELQYQIIGLLDIDSWTTMRLVNKWGKNNIDRISFKLWTDYIWMNWKIRVSPPIDFLVIHQAHRLKNGMTKWSGMCTQYRYPSYPVQFKILSFAPPPKPFTYKTFVNMLQPFETRAQAPGVISMQGRCYWPTLANGETTMSAILGPDNQFSLSERELISGGVAVPSVYLGWRFKNCAVFTWDDSCSQRGTLHTVMEGVAKPKDFEQYMLPGQIWKGYLVTIDKTGTPCELCVREKTGKGRKVFVSLRSKKVTFSTNIETGDYWLNPEVYLDLFFNGELLEFDAKCERSMPPPPWKRLKLNCYEDLILGTATFDNGDGTLVMHRFS